MNTHPLFSKNKMKLGIFGQNVSGGCAISTAEEALKLDWKRNLELSLAADRMGLEALVPVGRWRGLGGASKFNENTFETYTWAAGTAQATENIACISTSHVQTTHPVFAAKQAATIDHISDGRYALNIVCGWFKPEMEMFGGDIMEHDARYEYAGEWVEIVRRLWTDEEPFDYEGRFFNLKDVVSMPKPLHKPMPPIMNAGGSKRGQQFAAQYADIAFISINPNDLDSAKEQVETYHKVAREQYQREIKVWGFAYISHGETQKEAEDYVNRYAVELGDDVAADYLLGILGVQAQMFTPEQLRQFKIHFKAGYGGYPLVGTTERIVDELEKISNIGVDGLVLNWLDYYGGLRTLEKSIVPMMRQAGLRQA